MKKYCNILILFLVLSALFSSCKKEFSEPNISTVNKGNVVTIADVRAMEVPGTEVRITKDISVYGVVTMDETTGNLYKEAYITDATGNLYLRFISSSSLYIGDSIMVNLNGAKILRYNQMLQVDSLHPDNNIQKIATQVYKTPEKISITDLKNNMEAAQGKFVEIQRCWFQDGGQGLTYAYASTQTAESRVLEDIDGGVIDVRTSGYANFANDTLPDGFGSFIGVVAQYNSGLQLLIRNPNELNLSGNPPSLIHTKDFEDQSLTSGFWTTQYPIPNNTWTVNSFNGNYYGYITNSSGQLVGESWLISPAFDLSNGIASFFNFRTATYASNPNLSVYISTNYDGVSAPSSATWTDLTSLANFSTGSWNWVSSGNIDLSSYQHSGVYIAFKFTGTSTSWDTWELDEINVFE